MTVMTFERAWEAVPYSRAKKRASLPPTGTSVCGIQIRFARYYVKGRAEWVHYPLLDLTVRSVEKAQDLDRSFKIGRGPQVWRTLREAWIEAVTELAAYRDFTHVPPHWKRGAPTIEDFEALRRHLNSARGGRHGIPMHVLDALRSRH